MKKGATRLKSTSSKSGAIAQWVKPLSIGITVLSCMVAVTLLVLQIANRPVKDLVLLSGVNQVSEGEIEQEISHLFPAGFVSLDVTEVQRALENLPLVASATVEKTWSGELLVSLEEEKPVALWNERQLLSQRGDVLPVDVSRDGLSRLKGSDIYSRSVMEHFLLFNRWCKRHQLKLVGLSFTPSGWQLEHESGPMIWLDGNNALSGLRQLESVLDQIQLEKIQSIDMRYEQGFAVAWKSRDVKAQAQG